MAKTISYNRLWKTLIDKNMKRQDVKQTYQLYRDYLDNFRINSRR